MSTTSISISTSAYAWETGAFGRATVLAGRTFFSLIFIMAALGHFTQAEIGYAAQAGVPVTSFRIAVDRPKGRDGEKQTGSEHRGLLFRGETPLGGRMATAAAGAPHPRFGHLLL